MKREQNIVFQIIYWLQKSDHTKPLLGLPGIEPDVFKYHAWLMSDAGLIQLTDNEAFTPHILTWAGQQYAEDNFGAMRTAALEAENSLKVALSKTSATSGSNSELVES